MVVCRNIVVDSVKTGLGGKIGNKGCVSIHFRLLMVGRIIKSIELFRE